MPRAAVPCALLLLIAVWSPLPFGSVLPFDRAALQICAFVALAVAVLGEGLAPLRRVRVPVLALVAIAALGLLEAAPWPRALVGVLSPRALEVADRAFAVLAEPAPGVPGGAVAAAVLPARVAPSLVPGVSRATALHWLAIAAMLAAAASVGRYRLLRRLLAAGMLGTAVFEVVYGSDHWFKSLGVIWGVQVPGSVDRLRGTFVNPDHLALLLGMAIAVCTAWAWWALRRLRDEAALERKLMQTVPPMLVFIMLFVGLAFTGSRAGLLAVSLMLVSQIALLAWHYRSRRLLALGAGSLLLGFSAVALFGWQAGVGRWLETSAYDLAWNSRFTVYRASFELWQTFPWLGSGLGTFREALPLVQDASLLGTWTHAHSDLLELLVTAGVPALALVGIGSLATVRRLLSVLARGPRSEDRAAGLAGLGALTMAALVSLVDFGLTMPANACTLALVLGLAAGVPLPAKRLRPQRTP